MHLPKRMVVAYATGPPKSVMTASSTPSYYSAIGTFESVDSTTLNAVHPVSWKATTKPVYGKAKQAKKYNDGYPS